MTAAPQPPVPKAGRGLRRWLTWFLALALLAALAWVLDPADIAATLARISGAELALVLALKTLDRLSMAWKWWLLLCALRLQAPLASVVRIYYQGTLIGLSLPVGLGSDVLRGYWVAEITGRPLSVYASVVMEKVLGLVASLSWSILGAAILVHVFRPDLALFAIGAGSAAFVALHLGFFACLHPRLEAVVVRRLGDRSGAGLLGKARGILRRFYEAWADFGGRRGAIACNLVLSLAEQGLQIAIVIVIAHALDIRVALPALLAIVALHGLVYRVPVASGGWGIGELSAVGLYALVDVDPALAFALAFTMNLTSLMSALPGLPFLLLGQGRMPRRIPASDTDGPAKPPEP